MLATLFASTRVRWAAGIVVGLVLLALAVIAFVHWLDKREHEAVQTYETGISYDAAVKAANAEREANTNYTAAKVEQAREEAELRHEASKGDDSSVGPGVGAVLERLRREGGRPAADPARR